MKETIRRRRSLFRLRFLSYPQPRGDNYVKYMFLVICMKWCFSVSAKWCFSVVNSVCGGVSA